MDIKEGMERAERCMCALLPIGNMDLINTLLAGVCRTKQTGYLDQAPSGLCKFHDEARAAHLPVRAHPDFGAGNGAVARNTGEGSNFECFSVERRTPWQG